RDFHVTGVQTCALPIFEVLLDDSRIQDIWIRGEVTNLKLHGSGHYYFSLGEKSDTHSAVLPCVMWRGDVQRLKCDVRDGMKVVRSEERRVGKEWRAREW